MFDTLQPSLCEHHNSKYATQLLASTTAKAKFPCHCSSSSEVKGNLRREGRVDKEYYLVPPHKPCYHEIAKRSNSFISQPLGAGRVVHTLHMVKPSSIASTNSLSEHCWAQQWSPSSMAGLAWIIFNISFFMGFVQGPLQSAILESFTHPPQRMHPRDKCISVRSQNNDQ